MDHRFCHHANLIRDQMADDLERGWQIPYSRERLGRIHDALRTETAKSFEARPGHYHTLGFDPEYLMYGKDSIDVQLRQEFDHNVSELCMFYRFYLRADLAGTPFVLCAYSYNVAACLE